MSTVILTDDPTAGLKLVSRQGQNLSATRYLFFPGDVIDPDRKYQLDYLRRGGEEIATRCLRRTRGGLLPKAEITPLEVWIENLPPQYIREGAEQDTVRLEGVIAPGNLEMDKPVRRGFLQGGTLVGYRFYPGNEISVIMRNHESKGIVEVKALLEQPYELEDGSPGVSQILNLDFFPGAKPVELNKIRNRIEQVSSQSDLHKSVSEDMLSACELFQRWAETHISIENGLLRTRKEHQHTYSYSPLGRQLLAQLEMAPQDVGEGALTPAMLSAISKVGGGVTPELIGEIARQILAAQSEAEPKRKKKEPVGVEGE